MRFKGKTAIITGASRGIGLAIARRLVSEGARVVVTARKPDGLHEALRLLGPPTAARGVAGHADDPAHQAQVIEEARTAFGSIDLLVNNAGINPTYGPLLRIELGAARKVLEVNCLAGLAMVQRVHAAWMGKHGGAVVNVASIAGIRPAPGIGFYGASKAMLIHLTEELALELGPSIRVNAVAPGVVKTAFAKGLYEGREEQKAALYPLKRLGQPDDVCSAVSYLLSDDAGWITGQTLVVDGGVSLVGTSETKV